MSILVKLPGIMTAIHDTDHALCTLVCLVILLDHTLGEIMGKFQGTFFPQIFSKGVFLVKKEHNFPILKKNTHFETFGKNTDFSPNISHDFSHDSS